MYISITLERFIFAQFFIIADILMYDKKVRISGVRTFWFNYIMEHRAPNILMLCLGGNDWLPTKWKSPGRLLKQFPALVWSDILPRQNFFLVINHVGEQSRKYI